MTIYLAYETDLHHHQNKRTLLIASNSKDGAIDECNRHATHEGHPLKKHDFRMFEIFLDF